jgi:AMMECR1 domain-containing protein
MSSLEQPWLWLAAAAALQIQRWKEKEKEYLNNVKVSVEER